MFIVSDTNERGRTIYLTEFGFDVEWTIEPQEAIIYHDEYEAIGDAEKYGGEVVKIKKYGAKK